MNTLMQKIHDFEAKGFWQQLLVKVVCVVVGATALHFLPANISAEIVAELNSLEAPATPAQ